LLLAGNGRLKTVEIPCYIIVLELLYLEGYYRGIS